MTFKYDPFEQKHIGDVVTLCTIPECDGYTSGKLGHFDIQINVESPLPYDVKYGVFVVESDNIYKPIVKIERFPKRYKHKFICKFRHNRYDL